ncbi:hypothetical protein BDP27DRAFT_1335671 [Rhodocollybia butyracea]|uniref:Uncharacterized protein n=1 Tax=Rhodocollybia butyracea TaxID=206335 RepID=A0A9P5PJC4_9AGAR|nr:hypothetical protein BDP27DRAFT_1335671 [Rhodocollybia butyracea]
MKQASRKFIDLIQQASSKFANWDPPHLIEVGDYGEIDRDTGKLEKSGNIYDGTCVNTAVTELAAQYPPVKNPARDEYTLNSTHARRAEFGAGVDATAAGLGDASLKAKWNFGKKRAALLTMHNPVSITIPDAFFEASRNIPFLKNKDIVVEVHQCSAYVMYLSNKTAETVHLVLRANGPANAVGGGASAGWWSEGASGMFQKAYHPENIYTPLFRLLRRASPGFNEPDDNDLWGDTEVPWNFLDEDGEEEGDEDEVYE